MKDEETLFDELGNSGKVNFLIGASALGSLQMAKFIPPQALAFWKFSQIATCHRLENHGRKWEVRYLDQHGFSDADDEEGAKRDFHHACVNNALYWLEQETVPSSLGSEAVIPSLEALDEHPELLDIFHTTYLVVRNIHCSRQLTVPEEVRNAVLRMSTLLDPSREFKSNRATAEADATCMNLIRDYLGIQMEETSCQPT